MINLNKLKLIILLLISIAIGISNIAVTANAATDPDGRTIIEDTAPLKTKVSQKDTGSGVLHQVLPVSIIVFLVALVLYILKTRKKVDAKSKHTKKK